MFGQGGEGGNNNHSIQGGTGGDGASAGNVGTGGDPYGGGGGGSGQGETGSAAGAAGIIVVLFSHETDVAGTGGLTLGGAATIETELHRAGSGGLSLGGTGDTEIDLQRSGSGGLILGGAGEVLAGTLSTITPTGGLILGGAGIVSHTAISEAIVGTGGLILGGAGVVETTVGAGQVASGAPFLGGMRITSTKWISPNALRVTFSTTYSTTYQYQLYAGRTLIGRTRREDERSIVAQWKPAEWPDHITLLAVEPGRANTDYGSKLPDRPYNRVRVAFRAPESSDAKQFEIHAGRTPGAEVDATNVVGRVLYDRARAGYEIVTEPLEGSGEWNLELVGRDNRLPDGNLGTPEALTADVIAYPPDLQRDRNGDRFTHSIANGVLTVKFQ